MRLIRIKRKATAPRCGTSFKAAWRRSVFSIATLKLGLSVFAISLAPLTSAAPGDRDTAFGAAGIVELNGVPNVYQGLFAKTISADSAGRLLIAGKSDDGLHVVTRLLSDGNVDATFGTSGAATIPALSDEYFPTALVVDELGNIVFVGGTSNLGTFVIRFKSDGQIDQSFGDQGRVSIPRESVPASVRPYDVAIQPDGKVLVAAEYAVVRLNPLGTIDTAFGNNGSAVMPGGSLTRGIALQSDGKIVAVGNNSLGFFGTSGGATDFRVVRFARDGNLDAEFGVNGLVVSDFAAFEEAASDVVIDPQDRIIVSGVLEYEEGCSPIFFNTSTCFRPVTARYTKDGALDSGFGENGYATVDVNWAYVNDVLLQPGGQIVTVGRAASGEIDVNGQCTADPEPSITVFRQNADGSLDTTFGCSGEAHFPYPSSRQGTYGFSFDKRGALIQPDGKIVALSRFRDSQGDATAVVRLLARDDNDDGIAEPWDLTPDPFFFNDVIAASPDSPQLSNSVAITGIENGLSVPLRIRGGEVSVNSAGDYFSLNPGTAAADPGQVDQQNFAGEDVFQVNAAYTEFQFQQVVTANAAGRLTRVKFRYFRPETDPTYGPTPDSLDVLVGVGDQWVEEPELTFFRVNVPIADPGPGEILVNVSDAGIDLIPGMKFVIGWQGTSINNFPALYFENASYAGGELWLNGERFGDVADGYADVRFETWVGSVPTIPGTYASFVWVQNGDQVQVRHQSSTNYASNVDSVVSVGGMLFPTTHSATLGPITTDVFTSTTVVAPPDADGDGVEDENDNCPAIANADQLDTDDDGTGDACDAFPSDPTETVDTDGDGQGDNADPDDDNDGIDDSSDAFPLDSSESIDTDGDGEGNNADTDDDNDGMPDSYEIENQFDPLDSSDANSDADADGYSNWIEFRRRSDPNDPDSIPKVILHWLPTLLN